jgi:uncharacterized protein (DUF1684 family)
VILLKTLFISVLSIQAYGATDLEAWRADKEARLKAEDGWLTVVGLDWLKQGKNTVGAAFGSDVRLPSGGPKKLATIELQGGKASIQFLEAKKVFLNGQPVELNKSYTLETDESETATQVNYDQVKFYLIKRKNGVGVRIKDNQAKARKNFSGLKWFKPDPKMLIRANWVAYDQPKKLMVPDVLGNVNEEQALGYAEFQLKGKTYRLHPSGGPDRLFFVFKDKTNGKETYKASRFLYAEGPRGGKVVLDFNKAYNPPCAFTDYATCPRAPKENVLKVAIRAGEKKPF